MRVAVLVALLAGCGTGPVNRTLGARCDRTADCDDRCLTPTPEYPDGLCTLDCDDTRDCPGDAQCVEREGGVCLFECFGDLDCGFLGTGWTCQETDLHGAVGKVNVCRG